MKKNICCLLILSVLSTILCISPVSADKTSVTETKELSNTSSNGKEVIIAPTDNVSIYRLTWEASSSDAEYVRYIESSKLSPTASWKSSTATVTSTVRGYTAAARLTGLKEDTTYSYKVGNDKYGWTEIYEFKTSDEDGAFSFLLAGDPQIGATAVAYDTENWNTTLNKARTWFGDDIDFLMTAGDQVNNHSTLAQYDGFTSNPWLRELPLVTTVGNHDNGAGYSAHFRYENVDQTSLTNAGEYGGDYWIYYEGALIMSLNFNQNSVAVHKAFMENAIKGFNNYYGEPSWIIAVFHQPIYSQGVRAEEAFTVAQRDLLAPVMSELGVDIVLTGHDHVYTRAYMMNSTTVKDDASLYTPVNGDPYGSYYDPEEGDVFYLTANSASGSKYYSLNSNMMPFTCVSSKENVQTITKIDVNYDSVAFTTFRTSLTSEMTDTLDFFALHRSSEEDFYPPVLNVPDKTYIESEEIDILKGITAYDNFDGELTSEIKVSGEIDLSKPFVLTYTVTDSSGNTTVKEREFIPYTLSKTINGDSLTWKYLDDGSTPYGTAHDLYTWSTPAFNDSAWKSGVSPFGAIKGALGTHAGYKAKTLLTQYDSSGENLKHYFFRTTFDLEHPERVGMLSGKFRYDDACNIFINGIKVAGYNTGKITNGEGYSSKTSSNNATFGDFFITDPETIKAMDLKETGNVISVALYQTNATSSDIFFMFESMDIGILNPLQYIESEGATLYINELEGVKDIFIAKGEHTTYRQVKDNLVVHVTSAKFKEDCYSYVLPSSGVYTLLIRYEDSSAKDLMLYEEIKVTEPEFTSNGLQLNVKNIENVKVIRTAHGEYKTVSQIKHAEGSRAFLGRSLLAGLHEYTIQYRENGKITVAVLYNDGYTVIKTFDVLKKTPVMEQQGSTVTFSQLEGMKVLRYVKGEYTTSRDIKNAQGSVALTSSKIVDSKITLKLSQGVYSFCVQYDDESYNYYIVTIN